MHYFKREREKEGKSIPTGFLKAVNFGFVRLCRWMHFWNGGHLRSAPDKGQKSDEKSGRKNTSRAPAAAVVPHTTGRGKKGSPVVNASGKCMTALMSCEM